jgi:hypothetical protein
MAETILPMRDGLPKLKDFSAAIGGSGETLPEYHSNYEEYGPAGSRRIDGDLRGPQVSCAGAHESKSAADSWIHDGLPKLRDFPKEIGGSSETMQE